MKVLKLELKFIIEIGPTLLKGIRGMLENFRNWFNNVRLRFILEFISGGTKRQGS